MILDNGAYEGVQIHPAELNHWARILKPTVVVLPDCPGNAHKTLYKSLDYLDRYAVPKQAMMVLHAPNGLTSQFESMYNLCPVTWVGFSRLTMSYGVSSCRTGFAKHLQDERIWSVNHKHHALGMLNGDWREMKALHELGFESCDSSAPIWRGLHGYSLEDKDWPNYSFDPNISDSGFNESLADRNLTGVLEACHAT